MSRIRKTIVLMLGLAFALSVPLTFSTPTAAADVPVHLWMSRAGGWGTTNTTLSIPGPNLMVTQGDNVTLYLTGTDGRNHNWFIDYNNNSAVNAGEPSSPTFTNSGLPAPGSWNFTADKNGTYRYRSRFDTNVWGNITINPKSAGGGLFGANNTVLIVVGVVILIIAVLAVATMFWRRRGKRPDEPPPPPPPR
jgi:heme/copper-type cytochrome/quinol oxidase subunit 2